MPPPNTPASTRRREAGAVIDAESATDHAERRGRSRSPDVSGDGVESPYPGDESVAADATKT